MGAVLLDRRDGVALVFGATVFPELVTEWRLQNPSKKQFVTEAELLPSLVAKVNWRSRMAGAKLITFVDSNPAKFCLVKGTSESISCEAIVRACSLEDAQYTTWNWITRVPTRSNIADGPSRLEFPDRIGNFKVSIEQVVQPKSLQHGSWTT